MQITVEYLKNIGTCKNGIELFKSQNETDPVKIIKSLMTEKNQILIFEKYQGGMALDWANWLITRILNLENKCKYTIRAAELLQESFLKGKDNNLVMEIIEAKGIIDKDLYEAFNSISSVYMVSGIYFYNHNYKLAYQSSCGMIDAVKNYDYSEAAYLSSMTIFLADFEGKKVRQEKMIKYGLELFLKQEEEVENEKIS